MKYSLLFSLNVFYSIGSAEINKIYQMMLDDVYFQHKRIYTLHSHHETGDLDNIIKRAKKGDQKIILSTRIAETIYIEDVV